MVITNNTDCTLLTIKSTIFNAFGSYTTVTLKGLSSDIVISSGDVLGTSPDRYIEVASPPDGVYCLSIVATGVTPATDNGYLLVSCKLKAELLKQLSINENGDCSLSAMYYLLDKADYCSCYDAKKVYEYIVKKLGSKEYCSLC